MVAKRLSASVPENRSRVLFDSGDEVTVRTGEEGIQFLLVSGNRLREPVAWWGTDPDEQAGRAAAGARSFDMSPSSRVAVLLQSHRTRGAST